MRLPWSKGAGSDEPSVERTLREVGYFRPGVVRLPPGAPDEWIESAERELAVAFPPSFRAFLRLHNGLVLPAARLLSLGGDPGTGLLGETRAWRERIGSGELIAIGGKGTGDPYVLLPDLAQGREEYPVAQLDHETGEVMFVVASSFERFLWFTLDNHKRHYRRDGEWNERDTYGPWPYKTTWMVAQDPDLKRWRTD